MELFSAEIDSLEFSEYEIAPMNNMEQIGKGRKSYRGKPPPFLSQYTKRTTVVRVPLVPNQKMETERASNDTIDHGAEINQTKVSCDLDSSSVFSENKVELKHLGESEMKVKRLSEVKFFSE